MEGNQERVHYMNTVYPYNGSEAFMDFFGGYSQPPLHYQQPPLMPHDHGSTYWSMNMNSYRFGTAAPENTSYYSPYTMNDELMRMDYHRTAWEYPSVMNVQAATVVEEAHAVQMPSEEIEAHSVQMHSEETEAPTMQAIPEETQSPDGTFNQQDTATSQVWEDNIDPDNMTYEELLDLGEAVGTENRGLSQELIDLLPTSKYKSGGIFSRKKSEERCVICQMRYKRGDWQIHLPCKHVYHATCGSKWLSINKTCPVCNCEVILDETRQ